MSKYSDDGVDRGFFFLKRGNKDRMKTSTISRKLDGRITIARNQAGVGIPMKTVWHYSSSTPCEISVTFFDNTQGAKEQPITWVFARSLLLDGMHGITGQGDVQFVLLKSDRFGIKSVINMCLNNSVGRACVSFDHNDLKSFLRQTISVVPVDQESAHMDIDDMISRLINS